MLKPWMAIAGAASLAIVVLGYGLNAAMRSGTSVAQTAKAEDAGSSGQGSATQPPAKSTTTGSTGGIFVASAPGRVEPRNGEVRVGSQVQVGRVFKVLVGVNATVEENELLVQLDDDEARANMAAAEADAGAAVQERDRLPITPGREDVRKAEDAVYASERGVTGARFELDFAQTARRNGTGTEQNVAASRRRLDEAQDRRQRQQLAFAAAQAKPGLPPPSRVESMVSGARAKVAIAEAQLDKTRIRAPAGGTVLLQNAKPGEMIIQSGDLPPLVVIGDISGMRVRAEVDETDVQKIKISQKAVIRALSYPGKDFTGTVVRIAPTLAPPRIGQRGPRRPTDVEVIEVTINLDGKPDPNFPLLNGMRVDTYFRPFQ